MQQKCDYCDNKESCASCKPGWKDKFIPKKEVKEFFEHVYCGSEGYTWEFNTTNSELVPTHAIIIGYRKYCPYCGNPMLTIQDRVTLKTTGYTCICEGARSEIEFEKVKKELLEKQKHEMWELQEKYKNKLAFNKDKLLEVRHKHDQEAFDGYSLFSIADGKLYISIENML